MKTDAILFPDANAYKKIELTLDDPGADDMVVRTLVSAISPGTERWVLRGKHAGTQFPCVPGYHRIGIVESCGAHVHDFEPGDIVYGSGNRWKESEIISMWGAHVGRSVSAAAGYTFVAASQPNAFELDTSVFAVLAGVANRGIRALDVAPREKLVIIGAGIIGICAAQLAALRGASAVLIEREPERIALVERMGLVVVNGADPHFSDRLDEIAPAGFDVLYDSVGHAATTDNLVRKLRPGGRLLLQAQYFDKERCALDLDQIKIKEITIKTTVGIDAQDMQETLDNIRTRRLRIGPLITHRFKAPAELAQGYELLDKGQPFNLGIVFRWGDTGRE